MHIYISYSNRQVINLLRSELIKDGHNPDDITEMRLRHTMENGIIKHVEFVFKLKADEKTQTGNAGG